MTTTATRKYSLGAEPRKHSGAESRKSSGTETASTSQATTRRRESYAGMESTRRRDSISGTESRKSSGTEPRKSSGTEGLGNSLASWWSKPPTASSLSRCLMGQCHEIIDLYLFCSQDSTSAHLKARAKIFDFKVRKLRVCIVNDYADTEFLH